MAAKHLEALFRRFSIPLNVRDGGAWEIALRSWMRLLRGLIREVGRPPRAPLRRRLWLLRRGFLTVSTGLYRFDLYDPSLYVTDLGYALRCYRINGFFNPIVGNKLVLAQILAGYGIPHPRVLGLVIAGRVLDAEGHSAADSVAAVQRLLGSSETLVFRPHWSGAGEGIFFLGRGGAEYSINGRPASEDDIRTLIGGIDRYVVTAYARQAAYAREIFPDVANTLRVLTLVDEDGPFVASAAHRFGTSRSFPLDNWHQGDGGLCSSIDLATSTLGPAATLGNDRKLTWVSAHPETGRAIEGVRVPGFEGAIDTLLRAARLLPSAPCIGWDALLTDRGLEILEANSPPALYVWQVHAPLLADERVARFFARHGFPRPITASSRPSGPAPGAP